MNSFLKQNYIIRTLQFDTTITLSLRFIIEVRLLILLNYLILTSTTVEDSYNHKGVQ